MKTTIGVHEEIRSGASLKGGAKAVPSASKNGKGQKALDEAKKIMSKEEMLKNYESMLLIRRFEEKAGQLYGMGKIGGFCHLYIGQEAVAIGMQASLKKGDQVITTYRDHGLMLSQGSDPKAIMAELMQSHRLLKR